MILSNLCEIDMSLITMPGVRVSDFRVYHMICPFHTEPVGIDALHLVRNTNPFSSNYWNYEVTVPPGQRSDHTATNGIMIRWSRGSKYGWLCVDDTGLVRVTRGRSYI